MAKQISMQSETLDALSETSLGIERSRYAHKGISLCSETGLDA
jgi:hypothetical protein